jgi:hypothetical protein
MMTIVFFPFCVFLFLMRYALFPARRYAGGCPAGGEIIDFFDYTALAAKKSICVQKSPVDLTGDNNTLLRFRNKAFYLSAAKPTLV